MFDNGVIETWNIPSRFDLVMMSTGTQGMKTIGKGWTVVMSWDKVSGNAAWLVSRVDEGIKGVTSMNIGDVAQQWGGGKDGGSCVRGRRQQLVSRKENGICSSTLGPLQL